MFLWITQRQTTNTRTDLEGRSNKRAIVNGNDVDIVLEQFVSRLAKIFYYYDDDVALFSDADDHT